MRLLLDENVSPSITQALVATGHDAYHVRDRGLSGQPDHAIWRRAMDENRILVTINVRDFVRLAKREELHGGLITFPSGSTAEEQRALILRAIAALEVDLASGRDALNRWLNIDEGGILEIVDLPIDY